MHRRFIRLAAFVAIFGLDPRPGVADSGTEFFEKKIRPLFAENCFECHSTASKKRGGGLLLDSGEGISKGGDSGAVVEPGKPEESLLLTAVRYSDDALKMPPKRKLPDAAVADLESWIRQGAPLPSSRTSSTSGDQDWRAKFLARSDWWSLKPVRSAAPPETRTGERGETSIDRFISQRLREQGLAPAGPAEPRTLIRRAHLVITGMPPSVEEVSAFVRDYQRDSERSVRALVDRLLSSPRFGERWARHWMDVVRFTETHGNEWNYEVHHAWRYRDYLIRVFNLDIPYDQFIREHIAGDLLNLPRRNPADGANESVIGTAFYRFGEVNHDDCIGLRDIGFDIADNQIDTLTKAFQATTVACARCHDHKLDAISTADYHALLGVIRSSRMVSHTLDSPEERVATLDDLTRKKAEIRRELGAVWLRDAERIPDYLLAASKKLDGSPESRGLEPKRLESWTKALAAEKPPIEDPFGLWRAVADVESRNVSESWNRKSESLAKEDRDRVDFNRKNFLVFADYAGEGAREGEIGGLGLSRAPSRPGDFSVAVAGETAIDRVLPAGLHTNAISDKLNGTIRSPVIPLGKKNISFHVMGMRSSALRLVSNNCQLNYKNYRALISADWQWVTFSPPEDRDVLRTYAELMTMFDNPKFPDQLSALGGDKADYKLPWDKAAENPRSFFGVTKAVLHDTADPPKPELSSMRPLFEAPPPRTHDEAADRYGRLFAASVGAWTADLADEADVARLDALLKRDLLGNRLASTDRLRELVEEYRRVEARLNPPSVSPGVADHGSGQDQRILARGDWRRPTDSVPRRYIEVVSKTTNGFATKGSGRLELAEAIASEKNPLTDRVIVNRVWHHLFGAGIVRTVDDFGHMGETPSHPELLDHLASRFVAGGRSIKRLIREIVHSETFRASNRPSREAKELDPENRLLQHYSARRLDAESIRDSVLAVSGRLDDKLFGSSIQPFREKDNADRRLFAGPLDGDGRRSLYIKTNLMESPKFLGAFNLPGGKVAQGRRDSTNVPAQALALLNDPFVLQQAEVWAKRAIARSDVDARSRLTLMLLEGLGRPPLPEELDRFEKAMRRLAEIRAVSTRDMHKSLPLWRDVAHAIINLKEFITIP